MNTHTRGLARLALGFAGTLAGCAGETAPVRTPVSVSAAPASAAPVSAAPASAAPASTAPPVTDLSALPHPLPATIVVPAGARVTSVVETHPGRDGFDYDHPAVEVEGGGLPGTITFSTGAKLGWKPSTLAADRAEVGRSGHAEVVYEEHPNGNWAAAYRLTDSCYLHAWSPSARVWCEASAPRLVGVPCERVKEAMAVCLTAHPKGEGAAPKVNLEAGFAKVKDARARETLLAVGRAVATDDLAGLTPHLAPAGLRVGKRRLIAGALPEAVAQAKSLSLLFGRDCTPMDGQSPTCLWSSEGDAADGRLVVFSSPGYGVQPTLELARLPDGRWVLDAFGSVDLGEP